MLKAYFDESGIHKGSEACVVAGYFGKKGPWRRLENDWKITLRKFEVPLDEFRTKNALNKTGFFLAWDRQKHANFLDALGNVISGLEIFPTCYGIFLEDFNSLSLSHRRFLTGATWHATKKKFLSSGNPNKPYFVAFTECLKVVASYTPATQRVHFFFGSDRPSSEYAVRLIRYFRWRTQMSRRLRIPVESRFSTDKFGTIAFPQAKETPPLQAADLFAYSTYKHMLERRASGDWTSPPSKLLLSLLRNRKSENDTAYRMARELKAMISVVPGLPDE